MYLPLADPPTNGIQFFHFRQKAPTSEVSASPNGSASPQREILDQPLISMLGSRYLFAGGIHHPMTTSLAVHSQNVNTRLLVQKHVEIILDGWILLTTRLGKHVNFSQYDSENPTLREQLQMIISYIMISF